MAKLGWATVRKLFNKAEQLRSIKRTKRLKRIIPKDTAVPGCAQRGDGSWTETSSKKFNILIEPHFSSCINENREGMRGIFYSKLEMEMNPSCIAEILI